ncbi:MAG TPA: hypothetical protein VFO01_17495 [Trebonia sp.]|nr:hypothetical protein [Trebonia sp.]
MAEHAYVRDELAGVLRAWLLPVAAGVDDRGRLVNEACRLAEEDPGLTRAADLAARLGVSPRSLERLVRSPVGGKLFAKRKPFAILSRTQIPRPSS